MTNKICGRRFAQRIKKTDCNTNSTRDMRQCCTTLSEDGMNEGDKIVTGENEKMYVFQYTERSLESKRERDVS